MTLGAMVADVVARMWSNFDMEFIHAFEGVLFPLAALLLLAVSRVDRRVSGTVFRIDLWLSLALALGGLRSALWTAGMDVFYSNILTFIIGVIAAPALFFSLRKRKTQV